MVDDPDGPTEPDPDEPKAATDGKPNGKADLKLAGGSAMERADGAGDDEPDPNDPQLNFFTNGKFDIGKVLKSGIEVEYKMTITGKSIPNIKGGLINPYGPSVPLFSDNVVDSYKPTFIRDENRKVEKVVMYVTLKPFIAQAIDTEAGQVLLAESLKGKKIHPALKEVVLAAAAA